jgi:type II secretory pathway component PulK
VYGVLDEDRKVNVNTAPKAVLQKLPGMTEATADAILEWRRGKRGLTELRERSFEVLEELFLVDGMTETVFSTVEPFVTVHTDGKVNLNTAPPDVLKALGMEDSLVAKVLRFRSGRDNVSGTADDPCITSAGTAAYEVDAVQPLTPQETAQLAGAVTRNLAKVTSSVFRIRARGAADRGQAARSVEGIVWRHRPPADRASGAPGPPGPEARRFVVSPARPEPR